MQMQVIRHLEKGNVIIATLELNALRRKAAETHIPTFKLLKK